MVPVYIITCQLRHPAGRMAVSFTVKPFIDALKCAESFVNEWLENKSSPCRVKILLTEQDMNDVYQLYTGFLDSCSRPPEPANFPEFSPDRLLVAILYDASASYRQSVVDEALRKYDLVVTARRPFQPFKVGNRIFDFISYDFLVKITATGTFVPIQSAY